MAIHIRRREFIFTLGGAATVWPLAARAQQPAMPMVGFLNSASADGYAMTARAFRQGLKDTGFVEGQNVAIEYRWAEGQYNRLPALAADLVHRRVDVIAANSAAMLPAKAATTTIPIVFNTSLDPVQLGLVASLSRPGGNVTGVTSLNVEVGPKRLELLHELAPAVNVIGLVVNPNNPNAQILSRDLHAVAGKLGLQLHVLYASNARDFDRVFTELVQRRAGALVIGTDAFFTSRSEQLAALALRHAVPAVYQQPEFTAAGGLMSYGASLTEAFQTAGVYAGRILKGEKPADLPVQQITKVELIINLKTANALGLTVPLPLLGLADKVIE
jgi:putative tryptophan/tyrosine transport system substrate-binding protein